MTLTHPLPDEPISRPWDLVGSADLTRELHLSRPMIAVWTKRYDDFPKPIAYVSSFPVYDRQHVLAWLSINRPKMYASLKFNAERS